MSGRLSATHSSIWAFPVTHLPGRLCPSWIPLTRRLHHRQPPIHVQFDPRTRTLACFLCAADPAPAIIMLASASIELHSLLPFSTQSCLLRLACTFLYYLPMPIPAFCLYTLLNPALPPPSSSFITHSLLQQPVPTSQFASFSATNIPSLLPLSILAHTSQLYSRKRLSRLYPER